MDEDDELSSFYPPSELQKEIQQKLIKKVYIRYLV